MCKPRLLFFCGSLRRESSSRAMIRALERLVGDRAVCAHADIGRLPHYDADLERPAEAAALVEAMQVADGLVFVTPEYNYSIPGVLKNAIDWGSRPAMKSAFKDKPCFIVTVSGGALGGVRAQAHLKYVLNGMLAQVYRTPEIVVPHAGKKIENGVVTDSAVVEFAGKALDGFLAEIGYVGAVASPNAA